MGVFRIARAEFIKIFKKPSVYIMGVLLASVLALSLLFFDPIGKESYSVNIPGTTVGQVYEKFTSDNVSSVKKSDFDADIAANTTKIDFYLLLNTRSAEIDEVNKEFATLFTDLENALSATPKKSDKEIDDVYKDVKEKLVEYKTKYNNTTALTNSSKFYTSYITTNTFTKINTLLNKMQPLTNETAASFVKRIKNNAFLDSLINVANDDDNAIKISITEYLTAITNNYKEYSYKVINNPSLSYEAEYMQKLEELKEVVNNTQNYIKLLIENEYPLVFVKKAEYDHLVKTFSSVISQLNVFSDPNASNTTMTNLERHKKIATGFADSKIEEELKTFIDNITYYRVETKVLNELKETINKQVTPLQEKLTNSINDTQKDASSSDKKKINALTDLITSYKVLSINTTNLVNSKINLEATKKLNVSNINQYLNFDKFNSYEAKENLTRVNYYIKNGVFNQNYSDVFAFNKNSTAETNAYDFMFFAMKIATVLISAFAIIMAASLIASEFDSGTIKLLAMRPFKRWKIISGKLFATMFFVIVFILFSALISFVAGICLYPLSSAPVLAVINGQWAFTIHPLLLMAIYVVLTIFEVFFYAVLALSISTIFRSFTGALSVSFITFILAFTLNILFGGVMWYSFIPFINTDFFRFFGGSFLTTQTGLFNDMFTPAVLSNANIFISLGIYLGTVSLLLLIAHIIFKARDF